MPDSHAIDNALMAKLGADATLLALVPNNVHWDEAPPGMQQFVVVSLVDEVDEPMFGSRAYEDALYAVEARIFSKVPDANLKAQDAAARIDVLLEGGTLAVSGYSLMTLHRESRIRMVEVDDVDPALRWYRRGGNYRVQMSL